MHIKSLPISLLMLLFSLTAYAGNTGVNKTESLPVINFSAELQEKLSSALKAKGSDYRARTRHLLDNGKPRFINRLILEDSPYLLQHAHNPVNWYAWGDEAFAAAKRENKPIFLSIGYSTCHWCHVMEEESFDNPEIARLMNSHFISIKVDREQRPDIDALYMNAVMMMAGHGGWPMNTFLTPDGDPIHGGTYYQPDAFSKLLLRVDELWRTRKDEFVAYGKRVAAAVSSISASEGKARDVGDKAIEQAILSTLDIYDELQGGFGQAPKFPNETLLLLMLDWAERKADKVALSAVLNSLEAMSRGGIHDQVGGGFHRYSTDNAWLVPHFEKMLYNQALLARAYLKGWQLSGNVQFAHVTRSTLDYVLRDMTSADGGFYSATDADSEGEEGTFFLWSHEAIEQALSPQQAKLAIAVFDVTRSGNFEGSNILSITGTWDEVARSHGLTREQLWEQLDEIREKLRNHRESRIRPYRDEKIVTAWNGMMITTLALAGDLLKESRYKEAAIMAAEFVWKQNRDKKGKLWRTHLHGNSSIDASQEDYAYYAEALLQLYDVTADAVWLERAIELSKAMVDRFWDKLSGGFFMSQGTGPGSMGRIKESSDGAIPSGNSVALRVLQRLAVRTADPEYRQMANKLLQAFSSSIHKHPRGYSYMLLATNALLNGETGPHQYAGKGNVAIHSSAERMSVDRVKVKLKLVIQEGWHINSHQPLQSELIATSLSSGGEWSLQQIGYPDAVKRRLGFQRDQLALYEGDIDIAAEMVSGAENSSSTIPVKLRLQVCSDEICLAPETVSLNIPAVKYPKGQPE